MANTSQIPSGDISEKWYGIGYQQGMEDIACRLRDGGPDAVREWLLNNLRDADFRSEIEKWI